ncbi:MAG TPA: endonuclease/exonuclease/phosphatase family protein [Candidatus Eisenbacteria bacterium]|nr:endonuclease/exonuclease/phosphatase family protein [Candidatus Eisenbacteria bacterium]
MRIATWNIAGGRTYLGHHPEALPYGYGKENLSYFTQNLGRARPDIAVLQEVHTPKVGGISQAESIANTLGFHTTKPIPYDNSHIQPDQHLSLATVSASPIEQGQFYTLPHLNLSITRPNGDVWTPFNPTGFHVVEVDHEGQKVQVVNTHLHPFHYFERDFAESEFEEYRRAISDFFLSLSNRPTVIAGDFNYANLQTLLPDVFEKGGYTDAFSRSTTPEKGQQDHILFSRHFQLDNADVQRGSADHYLCLADVSLRR